MARDNPPPALGQSPKSNRSPQRRTGSPKRLKVKGQITAHAEHFLPFEFVIDRVSSRTPSTLIEVGTDRWAGRSIKGNYSFQRELRHDDDGMLRRPERQWRTAQRSVPTLSKNQSDATGGQLCFG